MVSAIHNLASLLLRTARCWPRLPAVAVGDSVLHDYASLCRRAAGLAAGLQFRRRQARRPHRARLAQRAAIRRGAVCLLVGRAHCGTGQREAAPEGARVRARRQRCARAPSSTRRGRARSRISPPTLPELRSAIAFGGSEYERLVAHRVSRGTGRGCGGRRGVAFLHERHHRPAQGCGDHPRQSARDGAVFSGRRRSHCTRRRDPASGAAVAWLRPVPDPACRARRRQCHPRLRRLRSRGDRATRQRVEAQSLLRGADDAEAPGRRAGARTSAARSPEMHRLRRRADVRRGLQGGVRRPGTAHCTDLRAGRDRR